MPYHTLFGNHNRFSWCWGLDEMFGSAPNGQICTIAQCILMSLICDVNQPAIHTCFDRKELYILTSSWCNIVYQCMCTVHVPAQDEFVVQIKNPIKKYMYSYTCFASYNSIACIHVCTVCSYYGNSKYTMSSLRIFSWTALYIYNNFDTECTTCTL